MPEIYEPKYRPWLDDEDEWLVRLRQDGTFEESSESQRQRSSIGRQILDGLQDREDGVSEDPEDTELASSGDSLILREEITAELGRLPDDSALKKLFWELLEFEPADDPPPRDLSVPPKLSSVRVVAALGNCCVLTAITHGDEGLDQDVGEIRVFAKNAQRLFGTTVIVAHHDQQLRTALLIICSESGLWVQPLVREEARVKAADNLIRLNPSLEELGASKQPRSEDVLSPGGDSELRRWLRSSRPISEHWLELQITSSKVLPSEKQQELFLRLAQLWPQPERGDHDFPTGRDGRELFNTLLAGNLRLAAYLARRYSFRVDRGLTFEDLYQAGLEGLCIAIRRFDASRHYRFATYAHWWVRQCISREIGNIERTIRIPIHVVEAVGKLSRCRRRLEAMGGPVSVSDLAKSRGIALEEAERLTTLGAPRIVALSDELDGASLTAADQIADSVFSFPVEEQAIQAAVGEELRELLGQLTPRQEQIMRMRFGIGQRTDHTLQEVGDQFSVTRERIRQIEAKALDRLRQIKGLPTKRKTRKPGAPKKCNREVPRASASRALSREPCVLQ